jgi:predicted Zn-dependent peptidase
MMDGHPLGHSILGTAETIQEADRDRLIKFYDRFYNNENCIFVIAGRFDEKKAIDAINKYFSGNARSGIVPPSAAIPKGNRIFRKHVVRDLEQIHFCIGADGLKKDDDDRWALFSMSTILGGNMSSRLFQNVREKEGLCYSIYSFHSSYTDSGIFGVYCGTSPDNFPRTLDLIKKECVSILKDGITEQELEDSKTYMKGNLALVFESTEVRMGQLARNEMAFGRYFSFEEIVKLIDSVTMEDLNRVCHKVLGNRLSLISIGKLNDPAVENLSIEL